MFELKQGTIENIAQATGLTPKQIKLNDSEDIKAIESWEKEKKVKYPSEYDNSEIGL